MILIAALRGIDSGFCQGFEAKRGGYLQVLVSIRAGAEHDGGS